MRLKSLLLFGLILLILFGLTFSGVVQQEGMAQQERTEVVLKITNICGYGTLTISTITFTKNLIPITTKIILPPVLINPRGTRTFGPYELSTAPNDLTIKGRFNQEPFTINVMPLMPNRTHRQKCLQVIAYFESAPDEERPEPYRPKPYYEGQTLEQVKNSLISAGVTVREKGSEAEPAFNFDPEDPMLIGALPPFSANLMFLTSPWTLRAVLTWDNPMADMDMVIFGIGGTSCWQLTPPGILCNLCDRPAPVSSPIGVFGVFIINWSPFHQAYVLAWSH